MTERRGIDRLVAIVAVSDFAIFLFLGFAFGWMPAGLFAIFSLVGLLVLTTQKLPVSTQAGTDTPDSS